MTPSVFLTNITLVLLVENTTLKPTSGFYSVQSKVYPRDLYSFLLSLLGNAMFICFRKLPAKLVGPLLNPLIPNIKMHIPLSVLHTFQSNKSDESQQVQTTKLTNQNSRQMLVTGVKCRNTHEQITIGFGFIVSDLESCANFLFFFSDRS